MLGVCVKRLAWNLVLLYWQLAIELSVVIEAEGTTILLMGTEKVYRSFAVPLSTIVRGTSAKLIANGLSVEEIVRLLMVPEIIQLKVVNAREGEAAYVTYG